MRIISFLLFAIIVHSSCANSSADVELQDENKVNKALSKKWESVYMETLGVRGKVPEEQVVTILFKEDGTFSSGIKDGIISNKGQWNYDTKTQFIYMMGTGTDKLPSRVLKLTGKELILAEYLFIDSEIVDSTVVTYKNL